MTKRILTYRFASLGVLLAMFYAWDWMPLRVGLRDAIGWSFRVRGYNPRSFVYEGSPALSVEGKVHFYSPECTYVDLLFMVVPFVWIFGATHRSNIQWLAIATLAIVGTNLVRCWAAVYLDVIGVSRFYAHDLPDYILWWPTVGVVVLLSLWRDLVRPVRSQSGTGACTGCVKRSDDGPRL